MLVANITMTDEEKEAVAIVQGLVKLHEKYLNLTVGTRNSTVYVELSRKDSMSLQEGKHGTFAPLLSLNGVPFGQSCRCLLESMLGMKLYDWSVEPNSSISRLAASIPSDINEVKMQLAIAGLLDIDNKATMRGSCADGQ